MKKDILIQLRANADLLKDLEIIIKNDLLENRSQAITYLIRKRALEIKNKLKK